MARSSFVALGAVVFPCSSGAQCDNPPCLEASVQEACAEATDCGSCVDKSLLGVYKCHWCDVDLQCHTVGSVYSACSTDLTDDDCVSKAHRSGCNLSECTDGSAVQPRHVHLALAGPTGMR